MVSVLDIEKMIGQLKDCDIHPSFAVISKTNYSRITGRYKYVMMIKRLRNKTSNKLTTK